MDAEKLTDLLAGSSQELNEAKYIPWWEGDHEEAVYRYDIFEEKDVKTNKCAYDQNRKKPGGDVQAVSPAAGPAPLLGPAVNRGPEAQPDELRHRASAMGLAPREGQVQQSRPAPESSTLPSCSSFPQRPP